MAGHAAEWIRTGSSGRTRSTGVRATRAGAAAGGRHCVLRVGLGAAQKSRAAAVRPSPSLAIVLEY